MKKKFTSLLLAIMIILSNLVPSIAMAKESYESTSNNKSLVEVTGNNKETKNQDGKLDETVIKENKDSITENEGLKENLEKTRKLENSIENNELEKIKTNTDLELQKNSEKIKDLSEINVEKLRTNNIFTAKDGGNVDDDHVRDGRLGIAKYFHIFANKAKLNTDTAGNIAVAYLTANSNFGTRIKDGSLSLDISYVQNTDFIQSSSFQVASGNRKNKAVFGENIKLTLVDNGNKVAANNSKLDHLSKDEIYQDKNGNKYIDFDREFTSLENASNEIAREPQTIGVIKDFSDQNNRYFDVSKVQNSGKGTVVLTKTDDNKNKLDGVKFNLYREGDSNPLERNLTTQNGQIVITNLEKGNYYFKEIETLPEYILDDKEHKFTISDINLGLSNTIYLDITKSEMELDRPIKIKGIGKKGPNIIVNVDTEGASSINISSEIKLIYDDGYDRPNHETENFSDAQVLWNFKNRSNNQVININSGRFQGSILAVGNTINAYVNVDGCIIADTVNIIGGESHRWDFQEKIGSSAKNVELKVENKKKSLKPEKISIPVEKKWQGKALDKVKIYLKADNQVVREIDLSESNNWNYTFENLPKMKSDGTLIKYTIEEKLIKGYKVEIEEKDSNDPSKGFTVTNKETPPWTPMEPPTRDLKITKEWLSLNGSKLTEPVSEIEVELYKDGKATGNKLKLNKTNNWTGEFKKLQVYESITNTTPFKYTIKEVGESGSTIRFDGKWFKVEYKGNIKDGFTVINKEKPDEPEEPVEPDKEYVKINVEKKWEGRIPTDKSVQIQLVADGKELLGKIITLSKDNNWKGSFENLPKYKNGKEIQYEIKEEAIAGYTSEIVKSVVSSHDKFWVMIKSPDELESGRHYLIAIQDWTQFDGAKYYFLSDVGSEQVVGLNEFNASKAFKNIDNGRLKEKLKFGDFSYSEYLDLSETNYTEDNEENIWLYSDINNVKTLKNKSTSNYITLKGENKNPIRYSFITSKKDGWKQKENYNWGVNYCRNLKFEPGVAGIMCKISGVQKWGNPPKEHVKQYINLPNGKFIGRTENPRHAGNFKFFKKVKQTTYSFTVTNKETPPWTPMEPPTRDIKITKEWLGSNGSKLTAPVSEIEVELYKDGQATGNKLKLNKTNNWTGEFKKLQVYESLTNTTPFKYTIKEVGESGSSIKLDGKWFRVEYKGSMKDGFTVTNKETPPWTPNEPPIREVKVKKEWTDASGSKIVAPPVKSIEVELYRNGLATGKKIELNSSNNWTGYFRNLDVAPKLGSTDYYQYTVKEVGESGSTIKFYGDWFKVYYGGNMRDGFIINNQRIPENPPTPPTPPDKPEIPLTKIKVSKEWKDINGNEILAPVEKIEVELYQNDKPTGIKTILNKDNNWTAIFDGLLVFESKDVKYKYSIREVGEKGNLININGKEFKVSYGGSKDYGFTITNTKITETPPKTPPTPPEVPPKTPPKKPHLPKTGDGFNRSMYAGLLALSGAGVLLLGIKKRKNTLNEKKK